MNIYIVYISEYTSVYEHLRNMHPKKLSKELEFLWSTFFNQDTVFSFLPLNTATLAPLPFAILLTAFFFITLIAFIVFIAVDFMDFMTVFFIANAMVERWAIAEWAWEQAANGLQPTHLVPSYWCNDPWAKILAAIYDIYSLYIMFYSLGIIFEEL